MNYEINSYPIFECSSPLETHPACPCKILTVKTEWKDEYSELIHNGDVNGLYLNYSLGWKCADYSFLKDHKQITHLKIIDTPKDNLSPIEELTNLECLEISCATKEHIAFNKLTNLKECFLSWWNQAHAIFDCHSLVKLYLDGLKIKDYQPLGNLTNLKCLTIGNSTFNNLADISALKKLEKLELLNCRRLTELSELIGFSELVWLVIDGSSKIYDVSPLSKLKKLKVLNLSTNKNIKSISPLIHCRELRAFAFAGSTIVEDGDLSPLTELPHLSMLMFAGRRNYSHKLIKRWSWMNYDNPDVLLKEK